MASSARLVFAVSFALISGCHKGQGGGSTKGDAGHCKPFYAADDCPAPPDEMKCWGDGDGCGPAVTEAQRTACADTRPCTLTTPVPGVVWPAPIRDIECGRGFGTPWCFSGARCGTDPSLCPCHSGMDLSLRPGTPVYAIYDGTL